MLWRYRPNGVLDSTFASNGALALTGELAADVVAYEPVAERMVLCRGEYSEGNVRCVRIWL